MKVGFISLGCSKNLIDTEMAIGVFKNHSFEIVNDISKADIVVINTCGFIEAAKQEAINTILETRDWKLGTCRGGSLCPPNKKKFLVVMGCLVERYKKELEKQIPEVDLFIPINEYDKFWDKIEELIEHKGTGTLCSDETQGSCPLVFNQLSYFDRVITTGKTTAYLKIAEGCSNRCTYCAIPYIRGPYISRKMEDILKEAEKLASSGIKEIIIIAQDTTKYGEDIYGRPMLPELLQRMCRIDGFKWIRFLYAYPESITDELIETVRRNEKICNYFDIPIQHISNKILKRMNRDVGAGHRARPNQYIQDLIAKIRLQIPDVILRTSLIVGFPGENQKDFQMLYDFVKQTKFDKLRSIYIFKRRRNTGSKASKSNPS